MIYSKSFSLNEIWFCGISLTETPPYIWFLEVRYLYFRFILGRNSSFQLTFLGLEYFAELVQAESVVR